ncbi:phage tail tape measure protein [Variovorax sp. UMC13]|uniref:phage tail tape measure protein n=1 Tax=Variovorax sp. UMC13 TaxID=1862326 RepID=UPI001602DA9E|nr:phage tail tape measure protein [Variovorax sp. UMC13]MBB1601583.1 phage tail tape measure protein [Variovorax sp. UMC13]
MTTTAIEHLGVKISVDASSVKTETQGSSQAFELFGQRVAEAAESGARSLAALAAQVAQVGTAQAKVADGAQKEAAAQREANRERSVAADVQARFLSGLRDQAETYGMSAEQLLRHRAAQAGVTKEAEPFIQQLQQQRTAQQQAAEAARQEEVAQREAAQARRAASDSQTAFLAGLREQIALQGKSGSDVLRYRAGKLGVGDDAEVLIRQMEQLDAGGRRLGVSAGQTQAALRMLPAQITDITTSIASGMPIWLIAIQQGGQIKDSFGGIGPTIRTLTGLLSPMKVALGGVAVAGAAVGLAYYQGAKEVDVYRHALVMSGNAAGATVSQLSDMARAISVVSGTQGAAAAGLAAMAGSGRVAYESLQSFTSVALDLERYVGVPVKKTVDDLAALGKEPVQASIRLTEQYNYLTAAVYTQIKALTDQGREEEAAALAQRTYASAMEQRKNQIVANLGVIERSWNGVKSGAKAAWDAMLNLGREDTLTQKIAEAEDRLNKARAGLGARSASGQDRIVQQEAALAALRATQSAQSAGAAADAKRVQSENAGIAASQFLSDIRKRIDKAGEAQKAVEKYKKAIVDAQAAGLPVPSAEAQRKEIAAIEKELGGKTAKPKAYQDDAATRYIQQLKESNAAVLTQLASEEKLTGAQKKQAEFLQQIADLKGKAILTADQKSLLAGADRIKVQLQENVANEALLEIKKKQVKAEEERVKALEQYNQTAAGVTISLRSGAQSREEQYDRSLSVVGMGSQARERMDSQKGIRREHQRFEDQLTKDAASKDLLGSDKYLADVQKIRDAMAQALAANEAYYADLAVAQGDWSNGAKESWSNYLDGARDVAGQTKGLFDQSLDGIEDRLTSLVATGKADFKSLGDFVATELIRMQIKAAMASIGSAASGWGSSIMGAVTGIFGGATKNAKGGVYSSPSLSSYSNGVYDTPRTFAFAKGAGIFAEAGPEAIMPLTRDSQGRLGVTAQGGGAAASSIYFAPTNNFHIDSRTDRASIMADIQRAQNQNNEAQLEELKRRKVVPA